MAGWDLPALKKVLPIPDFYNSEKFLQALCLEMGVCISQLVSVLDVRQTVLPLACAAHRESRSCFKADSLCCSSGVWRRSRFSEEISRRDL